jgi:hypothetical protein
MNALLSASIKPNESSCVVFNGFVLHISILLYFSAFASLLVLSFMAQLRIA